MTGFGKVVSCCSCNAGTCAAHACSGKFITRVENFVITLDPFLEYQIGPLYEAMRTINGRLFGMAGRTLYRLLEWWNSSQACALPSWSSRGEPGPAC